MLNEDKWAVENKNLVDLYDNCFIRGTILVA